MSLQKHRLLQGRLPLLISMPHAASYIPPDIRARMTRAGVGSIDTDWHVDTLYDFAREMGASMLYPACSRYVIDLNRDSSDTDLYPGQVKTGLCPVQSFAGADIYQPGEAPDGPEQVNRIAVYWQPYHDALAGELARLRAVHGYAVLYDAHSIASCVPRLFDGRLPDLNLGTAHGASCGPGIEQAAFRAAQSSGFSSVLNGRFVGGYITRHYGDPGNGIHALQMELVQECYMDEAPPFAYDAAKAARLQVALKFILEAVLAGADR